MTSSNLLCSQLGTGTSQYTNKQSQTCMCKTDPAACTHKHNTQPHFFTGTIITKNIPTTCPFPPYTPTLPGWSHRHTLTCSVTSRSSTTTSFVRKSAPMVTLYWELNFLFTYWFISEVLPTLSINHRNYISYRVKSTIRPKRLGQFPARTKADDPQRLHTRRRAQHPLTSCHPKGWPSGLPFFVGPWMIRNCANQSPRSVLAQRGNTSTALQKTTLPKVNLQSRVCLHVTCTWPH